LSNDETNIFIFLQPHLTKAMNHTNYLLHNILEKHNPYYRDLNPSLQKEFRYRTRLFTKAIHFRGGNGFKITNEHITAVSGAYIQITFGLSEYFLIDFDVITIYEKAYKSTITGMYHKGDVNPQGAIAISWEDFVKGYETDEDNLNVGLHEMAHAWFFSISMNRFDEDSNTYDKLSKFIFLSEEEVVRLRNHKKSIFRKYAADNVYEFFAVAIEYFFEDAPEFKQELPNLYRHMCILLNQDPANKIKRGFNFSEYFIHKNLQGYIPKSEELDDDFEKKDIRYKILRNKRGMTSGIFIAFILIFDVAIIKDYSLEVSGGISSVLWKKLPFIFGARKTSTTANYLILNKKRFNKSTFQAIHYDNIISADIYSSTFIKSAQVKYIDNLRIKSIKMMAEKPDFDYLMKHLIQKKIVIKKDGTRIPRLKSRNRWRK
jgi:Mlc titration factor MtfA (ptsG expression regulator)